MDGRAPAEPWARRTDGAPIAPHRDMQEDKSLEDTLHGVQKGRGKKVGYLIAAAAGIATLIGGVIVATRGNDIERSSAAMSEPGVVEPSAGDLDAGQP